MLLLGFNPTTRLILLVYLCDDVENNILFWTKLFREKSQASAISKVSSPRDLNGDQPI